MVQQEVRQYELQARSTETFGRVLCSARTHHFVVDGPIQKAAQGKPSRPVNSFSQVSPPVASNSCRYWPGHNRCPCERPQSPCVPCSIPTSRFGPR